jgi:hypothetical protein
MHIEPDSDDLTRVVDAEAFADHSSRGLAAETADGSEGVLLSDSRRGNRQDRQRGEDRHDPAPP